MSEKYDWVNVMEDMPGGDMVYKSEADSVVADLAARLERAEGVVEAAKILRAAQRDYMANRGNDEKGQAVATAAVAVDEALSASPQNNA